MELDYLAPIVLLFVSNIFMTFAWVRSGLPLANEMVQWTISSGEPRRPKGVSMSSGHAKRGERPELKRGAGGLLKPALAGK